MSCDDRHCPLSISVLVLCYRPSCNNCSHLAIILKTVAAKIFISALSSDDNRLATNFYDIIFTVPQCILIFSRLLFIQLNAQLDCSRKMLTFTLKYTLKCSYMFRLHNRHQGAYCCALLSYNYKNSYKRPYASVRSCGCILLVHSVE